MSRLDRRIIRIKCGLRLDLVGKIVKAADASGAGLDIYIEDGQNLLRPSRSWTFFGFDLV